MKILITSLFIMGTVYFTQAQQATRLKHFNVVKGIALQGYDPVAYFTQGKAVKGSKQWIANAEGIVYQFASQANRDLFLKNYKAYEPQYGGWCAYAMGDSGEKVTIDPETFKIVDGKLYLFYHSWTNNTLTKWNKDEGKLKANANKNWQAVFH